MPKAHITDITSIGGGKVCLAVLNGRQTRLSEPKPTEEWVRSLGGLRPGSVLEVACRPEGRLQPPHVEDSRWDIRGCRAVGLLDEERLAAELRPAAVRSVREAFGDPIFRGKGGNGAFPYGRGARSLATLAVDQVRIRLSADRKPRLMFRDASETWTDVPLQDLAVKQHLGSCPECRASGEQLLREEFQGGPALLRIGLTRPWPYGEYEPACWLQVNHVIQLPSRRSHFV